MSRTHHKNSRSAGMPRVPPMHSPRMTPPSHSRSERYVTTHASDRMMDVVEVGAVGIVGAGLLGSLGSAITK